MIYGIGTDIVEIERIAAAQVRFGDRFIERRFSDRRSRRVIARGRDASETSRPRVPRDALRRQGGGGQGARTWNALADAVAFGRDFERCVGPASRIGIRRARRFVERNRLRLHVSLTDERATAAAYVVAEVIE